MRFKGCLFCPWEPRYRPPPPILRRNRIDRSLSKKGAFLVFSKMNNRIGIKHHFCQQMGLEPGQKYLCECVCVCVCVCVFLRIETWLRIHRWLILQNRYHLTMDRNKNHSNATSPWCFCVWHLLLQLQRSSHLITSILK